MTAEDALSRIQALARPASVAQIGGFRPPNTSLASWFGGNFVGHPGETWPMGATEPMVPLLQVRTDELSYCPAVLQGIRLFTIFWEAKEIVASHTLLNGQGCCIRTYSAIDDLVPLVPSRERWAQRGRIWPSPLPVFWKFFPDDNIGFEAYESHSMEMNVILQDGYELDFSYLPRFNGTKIGGWPSWFNPERSADNFILEIHTHGRPDMTLLCGAMVEIFCTPSGDWQMHLDFKK